MISKANSNQGEVADRLLTIGKLYEAKKQKMREDTHNRRKAEEELIIQTMKAKSRGEIKMDPNQVPV